MKRYGDVSLIQHNIVIWAGIEEPIANGLGVGLTRDPKDTV